MLKQIAMYKTQLTIATLGVIAVVAITLIFSKLLIGIVLGAGVVGAYVAYKKYF